MTDAPTPEPDDVAAEFALGVLDAQAHRAAEARAQSDPAFQQAALAWSERLSPLLDEIPAAAPSPELWGRIEAQLIGRPAGVVDLHPAQAAGGRSELARVSRSRAIWRGVALTAMAASVASLTVLGASLMRPTPPLSPLMTARLSGEGRSATATYDPARRAVLLDLPSGAAPPGRALELWLLDPSGTPHALGVGTAGAVAVLPLRPENGAAMREQAALALSIEPPGGSPTGQPTGPVVAKGVLRPI